MLLAAVVGLIGLVCGVLWREAWEILKRLEKAARILVERQAKQEQKEKKMGFAEPTKWEELDDEDRIAFLNM